MKILIDIGHPGHVHYFKNMIKIMSQKNTSFIIVARHRPAVFELLKKNNLTFYNRGKGSSILAGKFFYMIWADLFILFLALKYRPSFFVSFASPYTAHVSRIVRKPHITFDDTEHAKLGHLSYQPFSDVIITPSCFYKNLGPKQIKYNGFIELCYLHSNRFTPNPEILKILGISENEKFVIVRFVSWGASHDKGFHGFDLNSKTKIIKELSSHIKIFISSESQLPEKLEPFKIKISPEYMHDALYYATLFLGEGGTMASESSILGTPAVYVNSLPLMGYLREDEKAGLLFHFNDSRGVFEKTMELIKIPKEQWIAKKNDLLKDKIDVTAFMVWFIENYPQSFKIMKANPDFQNNFQKIENTPFIGQHFTVGSLLPKSARINYKTCTRCILDESASDIWFNEKGECKYCEIHDEMEKQHPLGLELNDELKSLIKKVRKDGINKPYDCIVGVSGGRDSTYTLYTAVKMGLRPLAVHFDCGWNSDISVQNIKKTCEKLNVHLHTVVADWEEFKDLQISFLKASVPDADIPTDYAIYSVLYDVAKNEKVKYIFNGHSFRTEGTSPISWTYMDGRYIKSVHRIFGKIKKIKSFPVMMLPTLIYYIFYKRIREVRLMEYIDYRKNEADQILKKELDWEYYGGHHHENVYTKFFQSYYLPVKFGIDKRKTELSALVRSGQFKREEALHEIESSKYQSDQAVVDYTINKLGILRMEFEKIMTDPVKSHDDYATYLPLIRALHWPIKIAAKLKMVPLILYLKYAK